MAPCLLLILSSAATDWLDTLSNTSVHYIYLRLFLDRFQQNYCRKPVIRDRRFFFFVFGYFLLLLYVIYEYIGFFLHLFVRRGCKQVVCTESRVHISKYICMDLWCIYSLVDLQKQTVHPFARIPIRLNSIRVLMRIFFHY